MAFCFRLLLDSLLCLFSSLFLFLSNFSISFCCFAARSASISAIASSEVILSPTPRRRCRDNDSDCGVLCDVRSSAKNCLSGSSVELEHDSEFEVPVVGPVHTIDADVACDSTRVGGMCDDDVVCATGSVNEVAVNDDDDECTGLSVLCTCNKALDDVSSEFELVDDSCVASADTVTVVSTCDTSADCDGEARL